MKVRALPIAKVRPDPSQPRKLFEPEALAELAASIRENGLIQSITVRADPDGKGWIIVAGERRYRATLLNAAKTINAIVVDLDAAAIRVAQIVENTQRKDMTPLEEAHAYQALVDELGGDVDAAAKKLGMQSWRVTERTCLLRLLPEYQSLLTTKQLKPSQAFEMAQLAPKGQQKLFTAIRFNRCPSYNALRAVSLALREEEAQTSIFDIVETPPGPTAEERTAMTRLERKIDMVTGVLSAGFDDGEVVAAKRIDPNRAATYADKLALIQKAIGQMELALRAAAAVHIDLLAA